MRVCVCVCGFVCSINAKTALRIEIWSWWYTCVLRWSRHISYVFLCTCLSARRAHVSVASIWFLRGIVLSSDDVVNWSVLWSGSSSQIWPDYPKGSRHSAMRNGWRFFGAVVFFLRHLLTVLLQDQQCLAEIGIEYVVLEPSVLARLPVSAFTE